MTIVLDGSAGITNDGGYTGDGVVFADTTPANTLVTTTGGNVGIGRVPGVKLDVKPADLGTTAGNTSYAYRATISSVGNTDEFDVLWYRTASASGWSSADLILQRNVDGSAGQSKIIFGGSNYTSFWTNGTESARIDSSGRLLVGTTTAAAAQVTITNPSTAYGLQVAAVNNAGSYYQIYFSTGVGGTTVGSIVSNSTSTTYVTSSDYRLKEDVQPMAGALSVVQQLKPCTYKWKADGSEGQGFIAHELQAVFPDAVVGEKDAVNEDGSIKPQGIDTSFLVATLTAAIQEQQAIITAQAAQIQQLREKVLEVEEGTSNMLVENTNNLYETITALTARVAALEGK